MIDTRRDINVATKELEAMADTTNLSDLKSGLGVFLFRIERSWARTERFVQQQAGGNAQSWLSATAKLRRADPLLQYLKQARNAETHAIASSVESVKVISDRFGHPFTLSDVRLSIQESTLVIDLESHDIGIDWTGEVPKGLRSELIM